MRRSAALTPSRRFALAAALACATGLLATSTLAAQPIATAERLPTAKPEVSARPPARGKRVPRKPPAAIVTPVARVEPAPPAQDELVQHRWPNVPSGHHLSLSEQITERLTDIGNRFGEHLDLLSQDMFQLKVDGRRRRAHIRLGGGGGEADDLFTFRIDGEIQFDDLNARVEAHIDLGFHDHLLRLELPAFQVQADEYRGEYGVQLEVPVIEKRF